MRGYWGNALGRWCVVLGVGMSVAGCSGSSEKTESNPRPEKKAVDELASSVGAPASGAHVVERAGGRIRALGVPLATGASGREAADAFVLAHGKALDLGRGTLRAKGSGGPDSLPLGVDRRTGVPRFRLFREEERFGDLPVYRAEVALLVREDAHHPVVWAQSTTRRVDAVPDVASPRDPDPAALLRALASAEGQDGRAAAPPSSLGSVGVPTEVIFAGVGESRVPARRARVFLVETVGPEGRFEVVTDAATGDVLYVESRTVFEDVPGSVSALVTTGAKSMDCAEEVSTPLPYARVSGPNGFVTANASGAFVVPNEGVDPISITSTLVGPYFQVTNFAGSNATLEQFATPPGPANFLHNADNATDLLRAEVNGYVHVEQARQFLLTYVPNYPVISTQTNFPVRVNRTDGYCPGNAWYDYSSINFCQGSAAYGNTSFASVNHHEYGHHIVSSGGSGQGAYGEGMSDVVAFLLAGDPGLGYGFYKDACSTPLRNADNNCQYSPTSCSSCGSSSHACGNLISGALWSVRELLQASDPVGFSETLSSLVLSSIPMHTGTVIDVSIAEDLLILDDDDDILANGTPHRAEICGGFAAHGMPCPELPSGIVVSQPSGLAAAGPRGGPFSPESFAFDVTGLGPNDMTYSVEIVGANWLVAGAPEGTVGAGEVETVTVAIDAAAAALLPNGAHVATVRFTNATTGVGSAERTVVLEVGQPTAIYLENFESGLGSFSLGTETNNLWRRASDCLALQPGHSTPTSLHFGRSACDFNGGTVAGTITSPPITVGSTGNVRLRFNYYLGGETSTYYDQATVLVSVNGGAFAIVAGSTGVGQALGRNSWQSMELDLSSRFPGGPGELRVRFAFDSRDSALNSGAGFYVDDVEVRALVEGCVTDGDCTDELSCNGAETCVSGACVSGTPVSCDDGIACTVDACAEGAPCVHQPNDAACSDGSVCTGTEVCDPTLGCRSGTPLSCDDGDACTVDACDPVLGCSSTPLSCDDGNSCTIDSCSAASGCSNVAVSCDDGDPCTVDACDPAGGCVSTPLSCDDGDECTVDACSSGVCQHVESGLCSSGAFVESGGLVVLEAENFATTIPRSAHAWETAALTNTSGGFGVLASPNNGATWDTNFVTQSPELTYDIQFATTGTYHVWLRGLGPSGSDDSVHVGLDGAAVSTADRISSFPTSFGCTKSTMDGPVATLVVGTPGIHRLNVWAREDGLRLDKILLTTSASYVPSGLGPNESPRSGGPMGCTSAAQCDDGNPCTSDACTGGECAHAAQAGACADDGNVCTADVCSAGTCTHPSTSGACADDGNACTADVCSAGQCTHPDNGTCSNSGPCASFCSNPVAFAGNFQSGNLGTGAVCYETTSNLYGGTCGNFVAPRTLSVNGQQMSCTGGSWSLPPKVNGGYCVTTTAGNHPWAYFVTW